MMGKFISSHITCFDSNVQEIIDDNKDAIDTIIENFIQLELKKRYLDVGNDLEKVDIAEEYLAISKDIEICIARLNSWTDKSLSFKITAVLTAILFYNKIYPNDEFADKRIIELAIKKSSFRKLFGTKYDIVRYINFATSTAFTPGLSLLESGVPAKTTPTCRRHTGVKISEKYKPFITKNFERFKGTSREGITAWRKYFSEAFKELRT